MKNHTNVDFDITIIGSGPAGMTAGIYGARAGVKTLIIEKEAPGGKVIKTDVIENYPGFTSIKGPDLAMNFYQQAMELGVSYEYEGVDSFEKDDENKCYIVKLFSGKTITTKTIIVATGTQENKIGVPGEDELYGKGVSYCAVCDGAFFKDKDIHVVGGGLSAIEEAVYLTKFGKNVHIVHRRQGFRADDRALQKAKDNDKIDFRLDSVVTEIMGDGKVEKIKVKNVVTGIETIVDTDAVFPFIGATPITTFMPKELLNEGKSIITNDKLETAWPGLYAAGDVRDTPLRQVATAVGDGALAAQEAIHFLEMDS